MTLNSYGLCIAIVLYMPMRIALGDDIDESAAPSPAKAKITSSNGAVCKPESLETPINESTASAGLMFNLAEHPKSIRVVAQKLLTEAIDTPTKKNRPCPTGCKGSKNPEIVYRVAPTAFLPSTEQQGLCLTLERDTQTHPLTFPAREFENVGALNSWVMEFSQGRGAEGKALYEQCGANCSPRYTFHIAPGDTGLKVGTEVICGLARDRNVEDYKMSTALRSNCAGNKSAHQ